LGVFDPEYAKRNPVYEPGMLLDQHPERLYIAPGGTYGGGLIRVTTHIIRVLVVAIRYR
jgi:hypothetical protein